MTLSVKAAALSGFVQTLKALDAILDKAVAQAETRKIQPEVLLSARLAPDMLAFTRQIQLCCDFAKNAVARVSGGENPRFPDEEKSFAELKARIDLPPADPDREARQVERLRTLAREADLDPEFSEKFLRFIIDEVIRHHEHLKREAGA